MKLSLRQLLLLMKLLGDETVVKATAVVDGTVVVPTSGMVKSSGF